MPASTRPRSRQWGWMISLLLLAITGCAAGNNDSAVVEIDEFTTATRVRIETSFNRLQADVSRAVRQLHWAELRTLAAEQAGEGEPVLRLQALHINQRTVEVLAYRAQDGEVPADDVQPFELLVRAGRFGNPEIEAAFIARLRKVLAGDAAPVRSKTFELP